MGNEKTVKELQIDDSQPVSGYGMVNIYNTAQGGIVVERTGSLPLTLGLIEYAHLMIRMEVAESLKTVLIKPVEDVSAK